MANDEKIRSRLLELLDSLYEEDFLASLPVDTLCETLSISRQELEVAVAPLFGQDLVEKFGESQSGFDLRLTPFGKEQYDRAKGNTANERIRESLLATLADKYQENVNEFLDSDVMAQELGLSLSKTCFNLKIMEIYGYVQLDPYQGGGHASYLVRLTPEGMTAYTHPEPQVVFLSHAATDGETAGYLQQVIEGCFPRADVFVSTDLQDVPLGSKWPEKVLAKLNDAVVVLVLATERGMDRKWVWFETGAGWSRNLQLIPCCLGKVRKGQLPHPFSEYMGVNLDQEADVQQLIAQLSKQFGPPTEKPDYAECAKELSHLNAKAEAAKPSETTGWSGMDWNNTYIAYSGPLEVISEINPEPHDPNLLEDIKEYFDTHWASAQRISAHKSKGYAVAFQTDRQNWRRKLLNGELILMIRPKKAG